jgi:hypothetical protein
MENNSKGRKITLQKRNNDRNKNSICSIHVIIQNMNIQGTASYVELAPYMQYHCSGETNAASCVKTPLFSSDVVVVNDVTFHKEENGRIQWCHTECSGCKLGE